MVWGYADVKNFIKMNSSLMKMSSGGITLDYIDNQMTPHERDDYWYMFMMIEKERLDKIAESRTNGVSNSAIGAVHK